MPRSYPQLAQGEPIEMHEEIARLKARPLDRSGVLALVSQVQAEYPETRRVEIKFSRRATTRRNATTHTWKPIMPGVDDWRHRITLYPSAMNEKTVLHELAHVIATRRKEAQQYHNWYWKRTFADLLRWHMARLESSAPLAHLTPQQDTLAEPKGAEHDVQSQSL